ncbi:MAG: ABC-F family ATP-binding cassette domain-containing protein [Anaerolineales bacterium]|nr:ABC-F family ATP-binding cassette domain-containing protein [Anaerolineales bacterium]
MSLITAQNLAKSFGSVDIFSQISLSIPKRARIAIVGPNGIGKTTLLRILAGEDAPSAGRVSRARNLQIGNLPQEAGFQSVRSLWEECLQPFADLQAQEAELAALESAMSDPNQTEEVLSRYGTLQADFEHKGGYTYLNRIEQVLTGLGFSREEFYYPLNHLSGGQRTRALLARLLLSGPDLLILDEPTNHLDIQAVEWLEGYLGQWEGATLIVSHDRYFLDRVVNTIWEMSRAGFELYHGNYSAYLQQRQDRWERRQKVFESEKERLEKEVDYIKRNISGQGVAQARGRLRRLSRLLQAIEQVGLEAAISRSWGEVSEDVNLSVGPMSVEEAYRRVRALKEPANRPPRLHLRLGADQRSGEIVLRTHDLRVGYPGNPLFQASDIELRRLETAALIGPNGAGKTTFLKTILEQVAPLEGEVSLGASLKIGYFAQAHEGLDPTRTLVQEIDAVSPNMLLAEIRDYLARFLFIGEEVFKPVAVLSGGERGRLALAKLALGGANLLLLDEPTNHLDITSQEILQDVLAEFNGTILIVSHDRYLIDALATQIWEIDEEQSILNVYKGTYSQYKAELEAQREAEKVQVGARHQASPSLGKKLRSSSAERRRRARLHDLENQITNLEHELAFLAKKLENPPTDLTKVNKLGNEYVRVQKELDALMEEWGNLHEAGE